MKTGLYGVMKLNNGHLGEQMAKQLWPKLVMVESSSKLDRSGVDAYLKNESVQIKYDSAIAKTGNIYHEIYEKSVRHPEQEWRASPHNSKQYIFCTSSFAIRIKTNELARLEQGLTLVAISSTSLGFLIPLVKIIDYERKDNGHQKQAVLQAQDWRFNGDKSGTQRRKPEA